MNTYKLLWEFDRFCERDDLSNKTQAELADFIVKIYEQIKTIANDENKLQ